MYATISGIYENGQIILQESAPTQNRMNVLVVFVDETEQLTEKKRELSLSFSKRWQGQFKLDDNQEDARLNYLKQRYQL